MLICLILERLANENSFFRNLMFGLFYGSINFSNIIHIFSSHNLTILYSGEHKISVKNQYFFNWNLTISGYDWFDRF